MLSQVCLSLCLVHNFIGVLCFLFNYRISVMRANALESLEGERTFSMKLKDCGQREDKKKQGVSDVMADNFFPGELKRTGWIF